ESHRPLPAKDPPVRFRGMHEPGRRVRHAAHTHPLSHKRPVAPKSRHSIEDTLPLRQGSEHPSPLPHPKDRNKERSQSDSPTEYRPPRPNCASRRYSAGSLPLLRLSLESYLFSHVVLIPWDAFHEVL